MKPTSYELLVNIRRGLEEIPVRTYDETNLKLGMMQALNQVLKEEQADETDTGKQCGD